MVFESMSAVPGVPNFLLPGAFKSTVMLDISDHARTPSIFLALDWASGVGGSTPKMKKYSN